MKPFESILEKYAYVNIFSAYLSGIVELFPYTCNPTAMLKTALSCWICMSCKFFHAGTNMGIVFNSNWFQRGINIFQTCRHWHPTYKPAMLKPPQYLLYSWTAVWSRVSINKSARCIFLTLGSHGKICFKLGMDTVSKIRPPDYFLLYFRLLLVQCQFTVFRKNLLRKSEKFIKIYFH